MELTVVVVCSTDPLLEDCLASIPAETPVVVMANFPSSQVLATLSSHPRVRVVRHDQRNLGLLRQLATHYVDTPAVLYLDSDCRLVDGTIDAVKTALELHAAVSIPMVFDADGILSSVVSKCRAFTTPPDVLFIPSAFRLDVQESLGGYLFDPGLTWGEDTDPARRLRAAGQSVGVSDGLVLHRSLGPLADMASARRLGVGRRTRERVLGDSPRVLWRDMLGVGECRLARACRLTAGPIAGLYHLLIWRPSYKFGYWWERARRR